MSTRPTPRSRRPIRASASEAALQRARHWDLADIADYLTARSPEGALSVERRIRKAIDLITACPGAGRRLDQCPAIRVMPIGRYPYLVFYSLRDDEVVILHVRHGARSPVDPSDL